MMLLLACASEPAECSASEVLFGTPNDATGLDDSQCAPTCTDCGGASWSPPSYSASDLADWRAWALAEPLAPLTVDPYAGEAPPEPAEGTVCAVALDASSYRLVDHASAEEALAAGALVTHEGVCGLCSPLADLAVYAENPDLTEPVRACGLEHFGGTVEELSACIGALGFTDPCASIWAWNTLNTRDACLTECLAAVDAQYHDEDGSLNDCLQCDEDESGPVFRAVAGRTRRNTGLPSTMCRPCSEVRPIEHVYGAPG